MFPPAAVFQPAIPTDRTSHRSSSVARACACVRAYAQAWRNARCRSASPSHEAAVQGSWRPGLWVAPRATGPIYAVESALTCSVCSVHCPSAGGSRRFTGRTDPLSRGADYISSASYARRGKLVTTDGELRRPTSSRCTDGDATTAPIPRMPKSPFRLAASRPIRTCRTPEERSAAAVATCPALRPSA